MRDISKLLNDMLDAIIAIEHYAALSFDEYLADDKTQDAIMFKWLSWVKQPIESRLNFKKNIRKSRGLLLLGQEM